MIRVLERTEPISQAVTQASAQGQAWLTAHPIRRPGEDPPPFWQDCLPDLRRVYKGICAYYGCYVPPVTGAQSVDHYLPKTHHRHMMYTWSNFRFACSRMNARKHSGANVLDPFNIVDGWFVLDFRLMTVHPAGTLSPPLRQQVVETRDRLQLNTPDCIAERQEKWDAYDLHGASAAFLYRQAPFVALEAIRQRLLRPADAHLTAADVRAWLDS